MADIVAESDRQRATPSHVYAEPDEINSTRSKCSEEDDGVTFRSSSRSAFSAPIYANLFDDDGAEIIPLRVAAARTG